MHIRFILSDSGSKREDHQNSKIADSFSLNLTVRINGKCNNPNASYMGGRVVHSLLQLSER